MTTKPKTQKYHVRRRSAQTATEAAAAAAPSPPEPAAQGAGGPAGDVGNVGDVDQQISDIRNEGLPGRQLRMARRAAQRHGLTPASDYDAVRLLRAKGIDPFQRSNLLALVVPDAPPQKLSGAMLPGAATPGGENLPSTEVLTDAARNLHIQRIQQDIARRRRRRLFTLFVRLTIFVLLPTILVGCYFFTIATPMYVARSQFSIQQAAPQGLSGARGLLSGTVLATQTDSIDTQGYLQSLEAMLQLDQELGFKAHFSQENMDFLQRLPVDATNAEAYKVYTRNVKISYDPTEGVLRMDVASADPELSTNFSRALIALAEDKVDKRSQRMRADQMKGARESFDEAEANMRVAQQRVIGLKEQYNVISTDVEISLLTNRIAALEQQVTQDQLSLEEMLLNPRPNPARVEPLRRRIEMLNNAIAGLRSRLTVGQDEDVSLARIGSELQDAQADLETRNLMMQEALQQMETARAEANRQTRYLSTGVAPIPPDEPAYPRAFESTMVAFLIFCGIYLMLSLTVSILREQVSS